MTKSYLLDVYPNISSTLGARTSPGLWSWGIDAFGDGTVRRSTPTQLGSLTNWKTVITNGTLGSVFIKTDNTLWVAGTNSYGMLGTNNASTVGSVSSPVQVGTLTNWKQAAMGRLYMFAVKTDGTLWAWGHNQWGQLGTNNLTHRSSPTQVGSLTNWKLVSSGSYHHAGAVKNDGTLWMWGHNSYGQLGTNNLTHRSSPTQVGSLTNWKQLSCGRIHSVAVKTDGTLWGWGSNLNGNLGLSDATNRSSPVQVGTLTNWKLVSSGQYQTLAIKTDGTLWAWGYNGPNGQLGVNDTITRSSPTQVGLLTNWKLVSAGTYTTAAIKTDGTLWSWGYNSSYWNLGVGDAVHRSSPTQVGSLTNWKQVSMDGFGAAAIQDGSY